jgi:putative transposase
LKKSLGPAEKWELVGYTRETFLMSLRQACILFCISTSLFYYQAKRKNDDEIIGQLSNLVELHRPWGFWMMYYRLCKLRYLWNHERVYRVYTSMRLNLHNKKKKRLLARDKAPLLRPIYPNVTWSLDFIHDTIG